MINLHLYLISLIVCLFIYILSYNDNKEKFKGGTTVILGGRRHTYGGIGIYAPIGTSSCLARCGPGYKWSYNPSLYGADRPCTQGGFLSYCRPRSLLGVSRSRRRKLPKWVIILIIVIVVLLLISGGVTIFVDI